MNKCMAVALVLSLTACASNGPVRVYDATLIDRKGVDMNKYADDYKECQEYTRQVMGPGEGAVQGAVIGAGIGYLLSRLAGGDINRGQMARLGAGAGALGGAAGGAQNEATVLRNCLRGRGYSVLN